MDQTRLRKLAGVGQDDILQLLEKMYQGTNELNIDTDTMPIEDIQKRLDASSRALGLANRLTDPTYKKKHLGRIMSNMNTIRAALNHMIKQLDQQNNMPQQADEI